MGRILDIWRGWSIQQRLALVGVVVLTIAGVAVGAYLLLPKRDSDIECPPPCELEVAAEPEKKKVKKVDWPVYGLDNARTRYLPTSRVRPPYRSSAWSFNAGTLLEFSPVLHKGTLYIVDKNARTLAINAKNGKILWKRDVGGLSAASPAYADGRLFVVTLTPGDVQAMNPRNGKVIWERDLGARSETSPVIYKDKVLVGNESGTVFALDVKDGSVDWTVDTAGSVKGGVTLEGGIAYFGNYAGEMTAVRARDGSIKWQTGTQGASFGRTGRIYSTPAVAYGRVYVGSIDSRVYSFDAETGSLVWSQSTGDWVYPAPAVAEVGNGPPTVFIGSKDKNLYALDARTGRVRWQDFTGGIILGAASVIGDVVYVGVIGPKNGTIGYKANSGKRVFEHELGEYNPAISDGDRLYLTGSHQLRAFPPDLEERRKKKGKGDGKKDGGDKGGGQGA